MSQKTDKAEYPNSRAYISWPSDVVVLSVVGVVVVVPEMTQVGQVIYYDRWYDVLY